MTLNKNVALVTPFFHWHLIYHDPDHDKFVDCAIAGNADYLITNDTDFNILKQLNFPKISVLSLQEFELLFKKQLS
jgi:predicted nucleic acid-binding protein